jgi:hypothetical protein
MAVPRLVSYVSRRNDSQSSSLKVLLNSKVDRINTTLNFAILGMIINMYLDGMELKAGLEWAGNVQRY